MPGVTVKYVTIAMNKQISKKEADEKELEDSYLFVRNAACLGWFWSGHGNLEIKRSGLLLNIARSSLNISSRALNSETN